MKLKEIFDIKNIKSFVEGNAKYFYNELIGIAKHEQEQVAWRLTFCKDDCLIEKKCMYCECPPEKKAFVKESCNKGKRFPDMMDEATWTEYKKEHDIS